MKKSTISKIQRSLIEKGYLKKQTIIDENGKVTRYALVKNYIIISENDDILITQKGRNAIMFDDELVDQVKQFNIFAQ